MLVRPSITCLNYVPLSFQGRTGQVVTAQGPGQVPAPALCPCQGRVTAPTPSLFSPFLALLPGLRMPRPSLPAGHSCLAALPPTAGRLANSQRTVRVEDQRRGPQGSRKDDVGGSTHIHDTNSLGPPLILLSWTQVGKPMHR